MAEDSHPDLAAFLSAAEASLTATTTWMLEQSDLNQRFAGATPFLRAFGLTLGGHYLLRAAMAEGDSGPRTAVARFHVRQLMTAVDGLCTQAREGADALYAFDPVLDAS